MRIIVGPREKKEEKKRRKNNQIKFGIKPL